MENDNLHQHKTAHIYFSVHLYMFIYTCLPYLFLFFGRYGDALPNTGVKTHSGVANALVNIKSIKSLRW